MDEYFKPYVYTKKFNLSSNNFNPLWFQKLTELVLLSPGFSRRIHYRWFPSSNLSRVPVTLEVIKKYAAHNKLLVEHWDLVKICRVPLKLSVTGSPLYDLRISLFELNALTNSHFLVSVVSTDDDSHDSLVVSDLSLQDPFLKHILDKDIRLNLFRHKQAFVHASSLSFYTDSSLYGAGSTDMKMGIAWKQVDSSCPCLSFNASLDNFPSSSRAEIAAVLSAICTVPVNCVVHIFTDSENVITGLNGLTHYSNNFLFNLEKSNNYMFWIAIKLLMDVYHLNIITHKVKSHSSDVHNNDTDSLAKAGYFLPAFNLAPSFVDSPTFLISWNNHKSKSAQFN
ncbi:hypothetical protein C1645_839635 [Glomus cerebriforme]|uniref:RNase H type-1 domain-containing protein n=1 Tax=Glomus cerebriforme TaxID=658196 RepID=A0A397S1T0_9GLOM|nr:hypothetical protein C1645_839635 [Glomus cerebriforme]